MPAIRTTEQADLDAIDAARFTDCGGDLEFLAWGVAAARQSGDEYSEADGLREMAAVASDLGMPDLAASCRRRADRLVPKGRVA